MDTLHEQVPLPIEENMDADFARRALDELFCLVRAYRTGESFSRLMSFVARFRAYSPYNAMLLHIQMPGAVFVASPSRWRRKYGRLLKPDGRPLIILQPMGPVMFVFDVSDTEPGPAAKPLPPEVTNPFAVRGGQVGWRLEMTIENAKRDGVRVLTQKAGSQAAGFICAVEAEARQSQPFETGREQSGGPMVRHVRVRYDLMINDGMTREARYATLVHELSHLYCGHLGTPDSRWWPDRCSATLAQREFEAESVTYLVCTRLGIDKPSAAYLAGYVRHNRDVPDISLECIMKSAGLIEQMGSKALKPREDRKDGSAGGRRVEKGRDRVRGDSGLPLRAGGDQGNA